MKKRKTKHTRFQALTVQLNEKHVNPATGRIEVNMSFDIANDITTVTTSHNNEIVPSDGLMNGYFGENKTRILSEIPSDNDDNSFDLIKKLKRYDRIVAIDTNSAFSNKSKISLGIAYHLIGEIKENEVFWELIPINQLFLLIGDGEKIENKNWKQLIEFIQKHSAYNESQKIAIIVDSDLGNLKDYNGFAKPIVDDFYLPSNFELVYASDKSMDSILNNIIKACHSKSKELLPTIIEIIDRHI